jgi:hypothetical protein
VPTPEPGPAPTPISPIPIITPEKTERFTYRQKWYMAAEGVLGGIIFIMVLVMIFVKCCKKPQQQSQAETSVEQEYLYGAPINS